MGVRRHMLGPLTILNPLPHPPALSQIHRCVLTILQLLERIGTCGQIWLELKWRYTTLVLGILICKQRKPDKCWQVQWGWLQPWKKVVVLTGQNMVQANTADSLHSLICPTSVFFAAVRVCKPLFQKLPRAKPRWFCRGKLKIKTPEGLQNRNKPNKKTQETQQALMLHH